MPKTHVRVIGGGNTYVRIGLNSGEKVEFIASLSDTPGRINGQPVAIQGIGDKHPVEIATGYSMGAGTLTLKVWETWGEDGWVSAFKSTQGSDNDIWKRFVDKGQGHGESGYPIDLVEVLDAQRLNPDYIFVAKVELGADGSPIRTKIYQGCVITDVDAKEDVDNNKMDKQITITMMYTHVVVAEGEKVVR